MITVNKHGNNYIGYTFCCSNCGCEFTCDNTDIQFGENDEHSIIACPECGTILTINQNGNKEC